MKPTGTYYDLVLNLGYKEDIVIEKIELIDLLTIIPVLDKMKYHDNYSEKDIEIVIRKRPVEETDVETSECL